MSQMVYDASSDEKRHVFPSLLVLDEWQAEQSPLDDETWGHNFFLGEPQQREDADEAEASEQPDRLIIKNNFLLQGKDCKSVTVASMARGGTWRSASQKTLNSTKITTFTILESPPTTHSKHPGCQPPSCDSTVVETRERYRISK
ncbi:Hypothetical predicted protein [Pelobates cultripes]|uniref:Uncharacterized protein n=1 Tax=Pelobates cultripes TaxID=61616 RepID=A0AAD1RKS4_PELCU|nr:Hypothetical predicted protein [Pelobates cultripes]